MAVLLEDNIHLGFKMVVKKFVVTLVDRFIEPTCMWMKCAFEAFVLDMVHMAEVPSVSCTLVTFRGQP